MIPQEEFSLLKLAEDLGVSSQSLYHYFPSKEAISEAIAEEIVLEVEMVGRELPWKEYIREAILAYRRGLRVNEFPIARNYIYQGIAAFRVASRRSEKLLERFEQFMMVLERDGFEADQAVEVWMMVQNFLRRSDLHRAAQQDFDQVWTELLGDIREAEEGRFPKLEALLTMDCPDFEAFYEGVLDTLIQGISARYGVT
jgi:AcrR family transcriptional regulator